jgi:hypothetical protein
MQPRDQRQCYVRKRTVVTRDALENGFLSTERAAREGGSFAFFLRLDGPATG